MSAFRWRVCILSTSGGEFVYCQLQVDSSHTPSLPVNSLHNFNLRVDSSCTVSFHVESSRIVGNKPFRWTIHNVGRQVTVYGKSAFMCTVHVLSVFKLTADAQLASQIRRTVHVLSVFQMDSPCNASPVN